MADRAKNAGDVLKMMKDKDVKFLDLRFTDTKGKMQHVTADGSVVNEGMFADGFAFDGIRFTTAPYNTGYRIDSAELPANTGTDYEMGNLGHRPRTKQGYFPVPPVDSAQDIRSEMLSVMAEMGVVVEKHHHEVA